jgi:lysophospholipase L1-like esterase
MWWTAYSSRSTAVPVDIRHSGGTARVTINQQANGGKWNVLGSYSLIGGTTYTVTITSQPGPSSTCADAVQFAYLGGGGNQPPVANNDSAATPPNTPVTIDVIANDTDDVGINAASVAIVNPPTSGTAVPDGSGSVTYTPSGGFTGVDTFQYTVADGQGVASNPAMVAVTVNTVSAEVVIDNGGPGTSFTGVWQISGATGSYGSNSVWSRDGAKYTWSFTPTLSGNYQVSMWWTAYSSRSTAVPVDIQHSGGTARVTVNQQANGAKWNVLGTYSLVGGVTYTVTVTSQPGPSSTCADAVKFAYLGGGGNQPPVANNDSATTTPNTPVTIDVIANDTDDVGINAASVAIVNPPASGTAVPDGSGSVTYTPSGGFTGADTFTYTVADGQGAVSNQATVTVTVNAVSAEVVIDNGGPGTSFTGVWQISGASNPYGVNSVWSRDGAKYTWRFTPTLSGNYDVSMWWTSLSSRSRVVPVDIANAGRTSRITVNQQLNGGKWNSLGSYYLVAGVGYTVTITSQAGPSSTCADAVKFTFLANAVTFVAVGDSITAGSHDDIPADGTGYEPVLGTLLTAAKGYPNTVVNEGVSGDTSADGALSIPATLSMYPSAKHVLVMYGSNDAFVPAVPSGMGLLPGDAGYDGSYKDYMQKIITAILAAGKTPYLAEVPFTTYPNFSNASIQEYNVVIDELCVKNGIPVTPPPFYAHFQAHTEELADGLHPNGTGYQSVANLWFNAIP